MAPSTVTDLLLAPRLNREQVSSLLSPYGFKDVLKADANLQAMASDPADRQLLAGVLVNLLACVSKSANPDQALTYLERFACAALNKTRLFSYLGDSPRTIDILARTMGGSPYMAEILIRDPHHFYWVTDPEVLRNAPSRRQMQRELLQTLRVIGDERKQLDYLRVLKRKEMLRIGVCDLLRLRPVEETLTALSVLADALISAAYWICASTLRREHGIHGKVFTHFTVLALGKLGGGELNFSSDVDLVYLYGSDLEVAAGLTAEEYFFRLSQRITGGLNELTGEGYVYRVDLRLRPEGDAGAIAQPLAAFRRYYESRVETWERLAFLKARPVAGDHTLGQAFLAMTKEFVYDLPFDTGALDSIRDMKRKIDRQMMLRQQRERNVKLGTGGIREIELIAQSLQIQHGSRIAQLCERNTLKTLSALKAHSLLSPEECSDLTSAYIFLRDVENKLQMVNDAQTHSLPREREELETCARLLGYADSAAFMQDYSRHTNRVNRIFEARISLRN